MRSRAQFDLPDELEPVMARAEKLEWITIGFMALIVIGMFLTMGSSQAMKAAWIEDMLSFVAPCAFLISARYRNREPNERFPYGYHRSVSIAFLSGAVALTLFGIFIFTDSVIKLVRAEHPTLGSAVIFGHVVWSGWLMIGMLFLSAIPPLILGRMKLRLAPKIHDKTLKADADMNKADWQTALTGIVGIVGIGFGYWWLDGAAGVFISGSIVRDGINNLRDVVENLVDSCPLSVDGKPSDIPRDVCTALSELPWVASAEVRMREEGHVFTGEIFLKVTSIGELSKMIDEARRVSSAVDWKVHDMVIELEEAPQSSGASDTAQGISQ